MNIRQKIMAGYLAAFTFFVITGIVGITSMRNIQHSYAELIDKRAGLVSETQQMLVSFEYEALMARSFYLVGREEWETEYRNQARETEEALQRIENQLASQEEHVLFAHLARSIRAFTTEYADPLVEIRKQEDLPEADRIARVIEATLAQRGTVRGIIQLGEDFVAYERNLLNEAVVENEFYAEQVMTVTVLMAITALIIGLGLAWYLSRTISEPVRRLEEAAARVGRGDLTGLDLIVRSQDEVGSLSRSFSQMVTNLQGLTGRINASAQKITGLSADIRASAETAAQSANQSADDLLKATGKVEALSAMSREVAETADKASAQAAAMEETAGQFLHQMKKSRQITTRARGALRDLEDKLISVEEVNGLINALAEQATLLAKKAQTEVAFGESRRPADKETARTYLALAAEVQNRTRDAMEATAKIAGLIDSVQEHTREAVVLLDEDFKIISSGHRMATETGEAFRNIITSVRTLARQMQEAAALAETISLKLGKVTDHTEEQTRLTEQASEAVESLNKLVNELNEAVSAFKL